MPNFCSECGEKAPHKNKFCGECGSSLQEEKVVINPLSDFFEYIGSNYFVVEALDLHLTKKYFGPITFDKHSFFYPPKPEHIRFCEQCEVQLADLGWCYGPDKNEKNRYLCTDCLLSIVKYRNTWIVPLSEPEYWEDIDSIIGCVVFTHHVAFREQHCHIDKVRKASKIDKKLKCMICQSNLGQTLDDYDYVYSVSDETPSRSWTYEVCAECMTKRLLAGNVLKKLKKPSDIFKLRKKD